MEPMKALAMLDQIVSRVNLPREAHEEVKVAVHTIALALTPTPEEHA
jgi:hypothetical protein